MNFLFFIFSIKCASSASYSVLNTTHIKFKASLAVKMFRPRNFIAPSWCEAGTKIRSICFYCFPLYFITMHCILNYKSFSKSSFVADFFSVFRKTVIWLPRILRTQETQYTSTFHSKRNLLLYVVQRNVA